MSTVCCQSAAQAAATASSPANNVLNGYSGYYVNGVYVVPVTTRPSETYLIIGNDMPCNPNNNNSLVTPNPYYPNCNEITTSIVLSNWTTSTSATPALLASAAGKSEGVLSLIFWASSATLLAVSV